ncbi:MAG: peptide MFS transporter [Gemmatimonadaceae bacterium]
MQSASETGRSRQETTVDDRTFFGHPRGLGLLFGVEMWERFSFYGMRALLVLYLVNALHWDPRNASLLYGAYMGSVYLTPLLGGWLADRFIGTRRSLVIGGVTIAVGHFLLAFGPPPTSAPPPPAAMLMFYLGLGCVVAGTGFFKPNVSTMVGQLYHADDPRRDSGFTIFYMGINVGAATAPFICGWLGERVGWHFGFGAAGVGMLLGVLMYVIARDRLLPGIGMPPGGSIRDKRGYDAANGAGGRPVALRAAAGGLAGGAVALMAARGALTVTNTLGVLMAAAFGAAACVAFLGTHGAERDRVTALLTIVLFAIFFWLAFEQAGSSLTIFADRHTDRTIGSFTFPASWFQIVQPTLIIILAPLFASLWIALASRGREPSTSMKMVIGLAAVGAGFLFLVAAGAPADRGFLVSPLWLVAAYTLHTVGELCLSPVGLSYVTKVAPSRFASLLMGMWFLSLAAANYLGGFLASKIDQVSSLSRFFMIPVATSLTAAVVLWVLVPRLKRMTSGTSA